jgi:hypothetical protein
MGISLVGILLGKRKARYQLVPGFLLVGVRGFEPPAPASRRQCSTRLSYTPNSNQLFLCTEKSARAARALR